jgi:hypothetical protein
VGFSSYIFSPPRRSSLALGLRKSGYLLLGERVKHKKSGYLLLGERVMLLVKARVAVSTIHGLGLFAQEFIAKGTVIWRFVPNFDVEIPESALESLSTAAKEQVLHYACYEEHKKRFVLSSDDDRFSNHSDNPNTVPDQDTMVAIKDIRPGDEITCDYRQVIMVGFHP